MLKRAVQIGLLSLGLAGCGTTGVSYDGNGTYTVAAEHGSLDGSWGRAEQEARSQALAVCAGQQSTPQIVTTERSGILGVTPQRIVLTFTCHRQ